MQKLQNSRFYYSATLLWPSKRQCQSFCCGPANFSRGGFRGGPGDLQMEDFKTLSATRIPVPQSLVEYVNGVR